MGEDRVISKQEVVERFLAEPSARELTEEMRVLIRNPVARFLYYFMFAWALLFDAGCVVFLLLPQFIAGASTVVMTAVAALFALMGGSFFVVSMLARRAIRCYREVFVYGELCPARVKAVHMGSSRIGSEVFCKVDVLLTLPNGQTQSSFDYVNNFAVDFYLNSRDAGTAVRALYAPDYAKRCVLVDKLTLEKRFD